MTETPIDPINLRAEIEMLQGQLRAMRCVIAALIVGSANADGVRANMALMLADLNMELDSPPRDMDHARKLRLWKIGAASAARDLESLLPARR